MPRDQLREQFLAAHPAATRVRIPTSDGETLDAVQLVQPIAAEDAPWVRRRGGAAAAGPAH